MPNRISGKAMSAPGKRHFDSTKPLAAPRNEAITLAGTAMIMLLRNPSFITGQTSRKVSSDRESGRAHICDGLTWVGSLNAVTSSTYTGIRNTPTSPSRLK